ncbi:MAG: REP-associated tyrosine transposase [Candidatus Binatia bacterium]
MANYRRNFIGGGSFFFTVNLTNRHSRLLVERIDLLRQSFRYTQSRHPFTIDAVVVLPDHLHAIWTLPSGDADYAMRWRLTKTVFSRGLEQLEERSKSRRLKRERGIWQRRYWEHTLRDEDDFEHHCDYIHYNPVKHGYVRSVDSWPFSSFRKFAKRGLYPADWGGVIGLEETAFGERAGR